jgi:hypothetical protein
MQATTAYACFKMFLQAAYQQTAAVSLAPKGLPVAAEGQVLVLA